MNTHKTKAGTTLPILSLRGKDYLEVKYRLVWFREEHPDWSIETEVISATDSSAFTRATIKDEKGRVLATSHKFEDKIGFADFIEKSETGAIGRALALLGYGTQFTGDELDEGDRVVDSPVERSKPALKPVAQTAPPKETKAAAQAATTRQANQPKGFNEPEDAGDYVINFGKKFKGQKLKSIDAYEVDSFIQWCMKDNERKGTQVSFEVAELKHNLERYIQQNNLQPKGAAR